MTQDTRTRGEALVAAARAERGASSPRERLAALRGPVLRMVLTVTVLSVLAEYSVLTYASAVFIEATAGDGSRLAVLLFVFGVGGLAGNALAGACLDRSAGRQLTWPRWPSSPSATWAPHSAVRPAASSWNR